MTARLRTRMLVPGLSEAEALRRFHMHRQSLRARRLNCHPPGGSVVPA